MLQRRKYYNSIWLSKIRIPHFIFILWHLWLFSMTLAFFLFWCNFLLCSILCYFNLSLLWVVLQLSVRSQGIILFPEYPLLFSVATPADKHPASHPDGQTPYSWTHIYIDTGTHTHAQLPHPPSGSSNHSSCLWSWQQKQQQSVYCQSSDWNQHW